MAEHHTRGLACSAFRNARPSLAQPCRLNPVQGKGPRSSCVCRSSPGRTPPSMTDDARNMRIVLADDHVTVRQGLKMLIESQGDMTVVSEASDGAAAVEQARALRPDVVVMDISMPGMHGLGATRPLKHTQPRTV